MTSRAKASSSRRSPSPLQDEEEEENVIYSCALEVASTLDVSKFKTLVGRYQISSEFRPRLPEEREWCCSPSSGFGEYTSYLLASLRFPLNSFCRGLFHRLGIGPIQLNPNGWRTIIAMRSLMGTVQSQWTSSFIVISPQRLNNLLVFTNSLLRALSLVWLRAIVLLTGFGKKNSFLFLENGLGTQLM